MNWRLPWNHHRWALPACLSIAWKYCKAWPARHLSSRMASNGGYNMSCKIWRNFAMPLVGNIQLDPWPKWFMVIPQNDYHPAEQLLRKRGATSKSATNAAKNWRISVSKIRVNKRWNNPSNQHWPTTGDRYTIPHLSVCPHFLLFVLVWACTR